MQVKGQRGNSVSASDKKENTRQNKKKKGDKERKAAASANDSLKEKGKKQSGRK